jgi:energy-converting hydrogenase Eha subunit C
MTALLNNIHGNDTSPLNKIIMLLIMNIGFTNVYYHSTQLLSQDAEP